MQATTGFGSKYLQPFVDGRESFGVAAQVSEGFARVTFEQCRRRHLGQCHHCRLLLRRVHIRRIAIDRVQLRVTHLLDTFVPLGSLLGMWSLCLMLDLELGIDALASLLLLKG